MAVAEWKEHGLGSQKYLFASVLLFSSCFLLLSTSYTTVCLSHLYNGCKDDMTSKGYYEVQLRRFSF